MTRRFVPAAPAALFGLAALVALTVSPLPPARADAPGAPAPTAPPAKHFGNLTPDAQGRVGAGTPLQGVHRIVCLGDSITQFGEGPTGYVGLMRAYLASAYPANGFEVLNAGVSGNTSNDELARFGRDVLDKKPDLITVSVGVNDVWHGFNAQYPQGGGPNGVALDVYRANVEKMVTEAQAQGIVVVILSPTPIGEDLNDPRNAMVVGYTQALRDIARRHKCLFVDLFTPFQAYLDLSRTTGHTENLLTVDGVHMNDWGNRLMAETILTALLSPAPKGVTLHRP
jgi:lysophospholipase L1-like esterase